MLKKIGKKISFFSRFFVIFALIFVSIFVISNLSTIYDLLYFQFHKSAFDEGALFESEAENLKREMIIIPKISLSAPIIFPKSTDRKEILEDLKNGVVHYPKSSLFGKGNSVLFGHSSRPLLSPGRYDGAFLFLSKLEKGDEIFVYFKRKKLIFKTMGQEIIRPNLSDFDFKIKKRPRLYLITCWPPGTNLKRLVIEAELIK